MNQGGMDCTSHYGGYHMSGRGMRRLTVFVGEQSPREVDLGQFHKEYISFGRSPDNDLVLPSPNVSKHHGFFRLTANGVYVEDLNSTNGLLFNGTRVASGLLREGDILRIDDERRSVTSGVLFFFNTSSEHHSWKKREMGKAGELLIGREQRCDVVLNHVSVSKRHASIVREGDAFFVVDHSSTNGTFVNGRRVQGRKPLKEKDVLRIVDTRLIFANGCLYYCSYKRGLGIEAVHLVRTVKNKGETFNICNDVSLSIEPGELVAIIGGSGAGKTTLMNAICGYNRPTSGQVLINGEELYDTYDALKNIIGYVPQQDIVYDNLTLFSMLDYAAKLRLPDDMSEQERRQRVHQVIDIVELKGKENTMIRQLSGGQKKRASIAVELLSDPTLFFLDEPASGLDPGTERNLMRTLKNMTNTGKTVVLVTHSTLNLQVCDKIVFMGRGGNLCFYGNTREAEEFFHVDNLVDVYNMMTEDPMRWKSLYNQKAQRERKGAGYKEVHSRQSYSKKAKSKHSRLRQTGILSSRYLQLLINDRQRLAMVLLQAPILALLISLVKNGYQFERYDITKSLLFALSCSAFWIGMLNAIQDVCKERAILRREYMTGLHLGAYITSKLLVLGVLCLVQSLLLIGVFWLTVGIPEEGLFLPPFLEMFLTAFLTAFSATAMGLFASSLFKNPDRAMTAAPILLMPQILFSGLLFKLKGVTTVLSWFTICRWSVEGFGSSANLNGLEYTVEVNGEIQEFPHEAEAFFEFTKAHIAQDWFLLVVFVAVFCILSGLVLRSVKK